MINTIAKTTVLVTMMAATTLILASAQASASGVAQWSGTSNTYVDGCQFKENTVGTLSLVDNVWTAVTPATVKLKTRKVLSVTVESDDILRDTNGVAVTDAIVDYTGSTMSTWSNRTTLTTTVTDSLITADGLKVRGASKFYINIGGTATVDDDELDSETDYIINHIVTCIQ
jgi:hypothetical protein